MSVTVALARLNALTVLQLVRRQLAPVLAAAALFSALRHHGPNGDQEDEDAYRGHDQFLGQKCLLQFLCERCFFVCGRRVDIVNAVLELGIWMLLSQLLEPEVSRVLIASLALVLLEVLQILFNHLCAYLKSCRKLF